jgi:uncharacterized protein (DUF302 family)
MRISRILFHIPLVFSITMFCQQTYGDDGIIRVPSPYGTNETIDRLESALKAKGMTVFTRISHSDGAQKAGFKLRPTVLLVFGNPKVGTPLMQCSQSVALDLPQKALAYQDETGKVWLAYNDPGYIAARHHISGCEENIRRIKAALAAFTASATQ